MTARQIIHLRRALRVSEPVARLLALLIYGDAE